MVSRKRKSDLNIFVENYMFYNFCMNCSHDKTYCFREKWKKPLFCTFDLEYIFCRSRIEGDFLIFFYNDVFNVSGNIQLSSNVYFDWTNMPSEPFYIRFI